MQIVACFSKCPSFLATSAQLFFLVLYLILVYWRNILLLSIESSGFCSGSCCGVYSTLVFLLYKHLVDSIQRWHYLHINDVISKTSIKLMQASQECINSVFLLSCSAGTGEARRFVTYISKLIPKIVDSCVKLYYGLIYLCVVAMFLFNWYYDNPLPVACHAFSCTHSFEALVAYRQWLATESFRLFIIQSMTMSLHL